MSYKSRYEAATRQLRAMEKVSRRQREAIRAALRAAEVGRLEVAVAVLVDAMGGDDG